MNRRSFIAGAFAGWLVPARELPGPSPAEAASIAQATQDGARLALYYLAGGVDPKTAARAGLRLVKTRLSNITTEPPRRGA